LSREFTLGSIKSPVLAKLRLNLVVAEWVPPRGTTDGRITDDTDPLIADR
jgi:hypothetical protein